MYTLVMACDAVRVVEQLAAIIVLRLRRQCEKEGGYEHKCSIHRMLPIKGQDDGWTSPYAFAFSARE